MGRRDITDRNRRLAELRGWTSIRVVEPSEDRLLAGIPPEGGAYSRGMTLPDSRVILPDYSRDIAAAIELLCWWRKRDDVEFDDIELRHDRFVLDAGEGGYGSHTMTPESIAAAISQAICEAEGIEVG